MMRRIFILILWMTLLCSGSAFGESMSPAGRILPPISESPQAGAVPRADANGTIDAWLTSFSNIKQDRDPDALIGDTTDDNKVDVIITPTASPSDGDISNLSTADQIYDWAMTTQDFLKTSENSDSDDDVTDDNVESMATAGGAGTAPISDGVSGLSMADVWTESENTAAGYISSQTDDQNISGSGLAGTILTIGIENGTNEDVDLSSLQGGTGGVSITWSTKTTGYSASAGDYLILEDNVTVTGPALASEGDMITIACGGDWATANSYFDPNGLNIMGSAATLTLNTNMGFTLVYSSNVTWGWAMY